MKKIYFLLLSFLFLCGCSKPQDCIKSSGSQVKREVLVADFHQILVNRGIALVLTEGPIFKVEVQTGENLIDGIDVKVSDGKLTLKDNINCNWVRDYGEATVFVTAPNIDYIFSKTEKNISSNGVLTYPIIRLNAIDLTGGAGTGDFNLQVNNLQVVIENNNVSRYFISGNTNELLINFYDGDGIFYGENLLAKSIKIFDRGSNDMTINPIDSVTGDIFSTGNVLCKSHPAVANVVEHYQGRFIYE